jgi:F0F1-type ATP synthase assembly protein I
MTQDQDQPEVSPRARLYNLTSLAFAFPVSISVGAFIGYYLDGKLGTFPWLLIVFLFVGVAAGFLSLFRVVKAFDSHAGATEKDKQ